MWALVSFVRWLPLLTGVRCVWEVKGFGCARVCVGEGWGGLGGLGGLSGDYGGCDGEAARGEGSENMHGECGNDSVLHRARRWDYEGIAKIGFPHAYGSELLPRLTGDSPGLWKYPGGGGLNSNPLARGAGCLSPSTNSGETGRWTGHTADRDTAFPGSVFRRLTVCDGYASGFRLKIPRDTVATIPWLPPWNHLLQ